MLYYLPHFKLNSSSINIIHEKLNYYQVIIKNQYYMIHAITRIRCEKTLHLNLHSTYYKLQHHNTKLVGIYNDV